MEEGRWNKVDSGSRSRPEIVRAIPGNRAINEFTLYIEATSYKFLLTCL